ncbi:MAG: adenosine deaminase [Chloroflexi bacterium]|nr:adenosine deaminase [Chloroflexota bacterium]MQC26752.1 adenosine deaminase [Chloroflexota bacterium]
MIDSSLPLIDLHRHLDGSVRLETILDLGQQHRLKLPAGDLEGLRPFVQVTEPQPGIMAFIAKFEWMTGVLVDTAACERIAYENLLDAKLEGIDYIELRFSPLFMAQAHGLDPAGIVGAVVEGVRRGEAETGMRANLIGILSRHFGADAAMGEFEALATYRDEIVALDLAGDEANYPGEWFVNHFERARSLGWEVSVHAGEAAGPESVWQAVRGLGATRIGHGVRAMEDPELVDYLHENSIGIETNLTSNVQTSTVASYAEHPLKAMLEAGLKATINTDDPGISDIDLPYEYEVAAPKAGLSSEQIGTAQANALELAFLSSAEKAELLQSKRALGRDG